MHERHFVAVLAVADSAIIGALLDPRILGLILFIAALVAWMSFRVSSTRRERVRESKAREDAYTAALTALAENPAESKLKVAALEAGRAHYGGMRADGRATIYDEQAISNDINARVH